MRGDPVRVGFSVYVSSLWRWLVWPVLAAVGFWLAVRLPGVPYNIKEVVGSGVWGFVRVLALASAVLGLGMGAAMGGAGVVGGRWGARGLIIVLFSVSIFSSLIVAVSSSTESVEDIVGTPVWPLGWWLEVIIRLSGLLLLPCSFLAFGVACWRLLWTRGVVRNVRLVESIALGVIPCVLWGRTVVVTLACTDNVTELIAGGGGIPSELYLGGLWLVLAVNAGGVGVAMARRGWDRLAGLSVSGIHTFIFALLAYYFFRQGTVSALEKYDVTFSAAQFLLGANREATLNEWALLFRWYLVYWGCVLALGYGAAIGLRLWEVHERFHADRSA